MNSPPMLPGPPVIGHLIEFQRDPVGLLRRGHAQLGPIFAIRFGPKKVAVMLGHENDMFFFKMTDRALSLREVYRNLMLSLFGDEDYTLAAPREKYLKQRKLGLPLYERRMMEKNHIPAMVREANDWVDSLGVSGEFDLVEALGVLTMHIASRALVGNQFRELLGDAFRKEFAALAAGADFILPPKLPLPRFIRREFARKRLTRMVIGAIQSRRTSGLREDDTLGYMLHAKDEDGHPLSDDTIASILIKLVFGGHETTQSQLCWALIQLLQHPAYLRRVLAEQDSVLDGGELNADKLDRLVLLDRALQETERMRTITRVLIRSNQEGFERAGFHVPKGWYTMISPAISHTMPDLFSEPDRYDPDRFSPERDARHKGIRSLAGFGGGSHKCPGMNFALTDMKVILTTLLSRYELSLADEDPQPISGVSYRPKQPCLVRYHWRVASEPEAVPFQPLVAAG